MHPKTNRDDLQYCRVVSTRHRDGELGYSRELVNIVRHLEAYPRESISQALRNLLSYNVKTIEVGEETHFRAVLAPRRSLAERLSQGRLSLALGLVKGGDHFDERRAYRGKSTSPGDVPWGNLGGTKDDTISLEDKARGTPTYRVCVAGEVFHQDAASRARTCSSSSTSVASSSRSSRTLPARSEMSKSI